MVESSKGIPLALILLTLGLVVMEFLLALFECESELILELFHLLNERFLVA
jgi:hypothetical protein